MMMNLLGSIGGKDSRKGKRGDDRRGEEREGERTGTVTVWFGTRWRADFSGEAVT
jgi:hypothetical protein